MTEGYVYHETEYLPTMGGKVWIRLTFHPMGLVAWAGYISEEAMKTQIAKEERRKSW